MEDLTLKFRTIVETNTIPVWLKRQKQTKSLIVQPQIHWWTLQCAGGVVLNQTITYITLQYQIIN